MGKRKQSFRGVSVAISMAPANETSSTGSDMNALSNENLTISSDTTLNPAAEDEDILNVVLVPVLVMTLMISIAAIIFFVLRKRSAAQQRLQFPMYTVEHEENNEWESQLMDEELSNIPTLLSQIAEWML